MAKLVGMFLIPPLRTSDALMAKARITGLTKAKAFEKLMAVAPIFGV